MSFDMERVRANYQKHLVEMEKHKAHIERGLANAPEALKPIIELHHNKNDRCMGCDSGDYAVDDPAWPCRTIEIIAELHDLDGE